MNRLTWSSPAFPVRAPVVSALAILLASCASPATLSVAPTGATAPETPSASLLPTTVSTAASTPTVCSLESTAPDGEGPYYTPGAPERSSLIEPGMQGTPLSLSGRVLTTDCAPLPGAILDFWQADAAGAYDNVGFRLRGRLTVSDDGSYRLETVVPGLYPGRPAHIHVKVIVASGEALTTQIYFEGEAYGSAGAFVHPTLLTRLEPGTDGGLTAEFNFVAGAPG